MPIHNSTFITVNTLEEKTFSRIKTNQHLPLMYTERLNLLPTVHTSYTLMIHPSSNTKMISKAFFLPDEYSLDLKPLQQQQQQSQDPVLRTVHSWLTRNEKLESLTPLITGTCFLHAYYKRFL